MTNDEQLALELYEPPFKYRHGYVYDAKDHMVADEAWAALRIRGWGRISYMQNPEKLQDTVGDLIAQALTEFWEKYRVAELPSIEEFNMTPGIEELSPLEKLRFFCSIAMSNRDWLDVEQFFKEIEPQ